MRSKSISKSVSKTAGLLAFAALAAATAGCSTPGVRSASAGDAANGSALAAPSVASSSTALAEAVRPLSGSDAAITVNTFATQSAPSSSVEEAQDGGWKLWSAPYVWLFDIDGSISRGGRTAPVSAHLSDAVDLVQDSLDFGMAGHFEASRDEWTVFLDANFLDLGSEADASRAVLRGIGTLSAELDLDVKLTMVELGAARKVGAFDVGGACAPVEILGGARWTSMDFELDLDTNLALPRRNFDRAYDADFQTDWVDPFIGVRTFVPLTEGLVLSFRADIGGGVGSGSDRAWNVVTGLNWNLSESTDLFAGYRWFDFERDIAGRESNLQLEGPGLGVVIRF